MSRHGKYAQGTVKVQITMPEELRDDLRTAAREKGTTVSEILRQGAVRWLKNPPERA